jgi:hypothetical protein
MTRYVSTFAILVLCALLAVPYGAVAQQDNGNGDGGEPRRAASRPEDITPEAQKAIDRGLQWLSRNQSRSGAYKHGNQDAVGITGLAGIAFMAGGHVPGRGKYGKNVEDCVKYVLKNTNMTTGYINSGNSRMYQHGFAMLFLAEAFGMTNDPDVRKALIKSVQLLQQSQNPEGGWRYSPTPTDADISVTICQIMALRAARNAGITVEKGVIDKGIEYVKKCYSARNGSFGYMPGSSGRYSSTAAGVCSLFYAGEYHTDEAQGGLKYLKKNLKQAFRMYPMYGNYYAVQAMHLAPDRERYWKAYFDHAREKIVGDQRADGSWSYSQGTHYSTAMALIILQVPNEYLPILQH